MKVRLDLSKAGTGSPLPYRHIWIDFPDNEQVNLNEVRRNNQ